MVNTCALTLLADWQRRQSSIDSTAHAGWIIASEPGPPMPVLQISLFAYGRSVAYQITAEQMEQAKGDILAQAVESMIQKLTKPRGALRGEQ